jgi:hypothetical protein
LLAASALYPRAKIEEAPAAVNAEYTVCVAAFDVTGLPLSQKILGNIIQNRFAARLAALDSHIRTDAEFALYEEAAWNAAREAAALKLKNKRAERDALLYRGYPDWKYKTELKKIDKEIAVFENDLEQAVNVKPVVERAPLIKVVSGFPEPPEPGGEEIFLQGQGADAFIAGKLLPYYERIYMEVKLYTRFSSLVYEDSLAFSMDDLNNAIEELSGRAEVAVAGREQSRLAVYTEPENARVLVNNKKLASSGETVTLNPGEVSVVVTAEDHETARGTVSLASGETAAADVKLTPFVMEQLKLDLTSPGENNRVYIGALYAGQFPPPEGDFMIPLPEGYYRYINVETDDGRGASAVVLGEERRNGGERVLNLAPRPFLGPDEKPVDRRRRQFYGAWGRLWVTLPLAVLIDGVARSTIDSYNASGGHGAASLRNDADLYKNIATGAWISAGVFGAESIIRLILYVRAANREAVPLWE